MSTIPLVSVIVPNYNYARYLNARIDSILSQTFQDFELILLDDCSTDNSREVLESYRNNPHVSHIVFNEQNSGSPFQQWMKGIELAKGKYIWIAEADDLADNTLLESSITRATENPDTAICFVGSKLFDSYGNIEKRDVNHWGKRRLKAQSNVFDGHKYALKNLYWKNYIINASAVIFDRQKALAVSPRFLSMRYCGDYQFWFELAQKGKVIEVYQSLNYFRQHQSKATVASHNSGAGVKEDIDIVAYMEQHLPPLSFYRKSLRRGLLYRKISRHKMRIEYKAPLYQYLNEKLGGGKKDRLFQKSNKFIRLLFPFLPSPSSDRL